MNILVTGVAGFIGMHVAKRLIKENHYVVGIDNLNDYYDVNLKKSRLKIILNEKKSFKFLQIDLINKNKLC